MVAVGQDLYISHRHAKMTQPMSFDIVPAIIPILNGDPHVRYATVPRFGGAYAAGDDGHIWSCVKLGGQVRVLTARWRRLQATLLNGYWNVTILQHTGKYRPFPVHIMVLEAWRGPCPSGLECRHLNDIRTDNSLTNLAWGTHSQNMLDRGVNGDPTFRGDGHPQAVLTADLVAAMRLAVAGGERVNAVAARLDVPLEAAYGAVRGRSWAHLPGAIRLRSTIAPEEKLLIAELRSAGLGIQEICDRTGIGYMTVYNWTVRRERRRT